MNDIRITELPAADVEVIEIVKAQYLDGSRIHLWFNDGTDRIVDFGPFLCRKRHPVFKKYLDVNEFRTFRVLHGNLDWNDYEMCFPIADLYEGKV